MKKVSKIFLNALPILLMIALIPFVKNDSLLTISYIGIIIVALSLKLEKNDISVLIFGFIAMILFEYIFIKTGVEVFLRNSLFGIMPLWLPFLWAYGFVAIRRSIEIINS